MKPEYWDKAKRALARRDATMAAIMRAHPKVFLAKRGEPFLTLARAICGQQISVKAAQRVWDRVCLCVGEITPQGVLGKKRPELRAWEGGQVRCHYPLGDPSREQRIARDLPLRVERTA